MTLRAASSLVFLAVDLEKYGAASNKTIQGFESQWPRQPISIVYSFRSETLRLQVTQSLQVNSCFEIYDLWLLEDSQGSCEG